MEPLCFATDEDKQHEFLLAEYERLGQLLIMSEAEGERRLTMLLTATAGAAIFLEFLARDGSPFFLPSKAGFSVLLIALALLFLLGHLTARRLVKRDWTTDQIKAARDEIQRVYLARGDLRPFKAAFFALSTESTVSGQSGAGEYKRLRGFGLGNGGWMISTLVLTSLIAGGFVAALAATATFLDAPHTWDRRTGLPRTADTLGFLALGLLAATLAWLLQLHWARRRYQDCA